MESIIVIIGVCFVAIILANMIACQNTYGKLSSDEEIKILLDEYPATHINKYNKTLIGLKHGGFIAKIMDIDSNKYIYYPNYECVRIPIWSKYNAKIDELYKNLPSFEEYYLK